MVGIEKFRGEFLIFASKRASYKDRDDYEQLLWLCDQTPDLVACDVRSAMPSFEALERGGIVGIGQVAGLLRDSDSPWFTGPVALMLEAVVQLPFTPCKGTGVFFEIDERALGLRSAIANARLPMTSSEAA